MTKTTFLVAFLSVFSVAYSATNKCVGQAEYTLKFYGMWSNASHMGAFPDGGKFSPLIGCSHSNGYTMWAPGMKASDGVKYVAEMGNATTLYNEIMMAIKYNKTAWMAFMGSSATNGNAHMVPPLNVKVARDFSLVSLVTMIAPSPDWFIGIMNKDLCNGTAGTWLDSMTIDMLDPWDAGTDSGNMFNSSNMPTNPTGNIERITNDSDTPFKNVQQESIATLGKLMFERINKPTAHMQCSGEETYNVRFEGMWTMQSHMNGFPGSSRAHFSPIVSATHSYKYQFWGDMIRASPGVKKVAETGVADTLYSEINGNKLGFVFNAYKRGSTSGATENVTMQIKVKAMYSWVSLITMIAPSPDWFVGVDSYNLCGMDGWKDSAIVDLLPWDAGTDHGFDFASPNNSTVPPDVITRITTSSDTVMKDDAAKSFAKLVFTREEMTTMSTTTSKASTHGPASLALTLLVTAFLVALRLLN